MPARWAPCRCRTPNQAPVQLIDIASHRGARNGTSSLKATDAAYLWSSPEEWGDLANRPTITKWLEGASARPRLCHCFRRRGDRLRSSHHRRLDADRRVREATRRGDPVSSMAGQFDVEGHASCRSIREGTVGIHARALGGASLPLSERFLAGAANMNAGS
jgi:hypothetical protein